MYDFVIGDFGHDNFIHCFFVSLFILNLLCIFVKSAVGGKDLLISKPHTYFFHSEK